MAARPNILWITTDQQRWDALSYWGTAGYRTPNLDRLAANGVLPRNAYCPSPVCTPARVSMITGLYPPRHGAYQIGMSPVPALEHNTVAHLLSRAGYRTACIGKTHWVARNLEARHIAGDIDGPEPDASFWDTFDGPYCGFEFLRHNAGHTCNQPPDGHYRSWLRRRGKQLDGLHWPAKPPDAAGVDSGRWDIDETDTSTAWITEEGLRWIGTRIERSEPWFCMLNYQDPHAPYVCPDPWYSDVDMGGVSLPALREGEMDSKPAFYRSFIEHGRYLDDSGGSLADDQKIASLFPGSFPADQHRAHQGYRAMVSMLDAYIGRVLAKLEQNGQIENTLIIFTSDHGDFLGNHGVYEKGVFAYDDCQRVPAILHWPVAQGARRGVLDAAFNHVDMLPTSLEAAGIEIPQGVQGHSLLPALRGEPDKVPDWALVDFYVSSKLHQQTLVHGDWKLVVYRDQDWGELYNLADDPRQYENHFDNARYDAIRRTMIHRLVQVNMRVSGKPGVRSAYA